MPRQAGRITEITAVGESATQVGVLQREPRQPRRLFGPFQADRARLRKAQIMLAMAIPDAGLLAGGGQAGRGVSTDGLQHAVAGAIAVVVAVVDDHERLVHEQGQHVDHLVCLDVTAGANVFGGFNAEPAGEHRQPAEHDLLDGGQQGVAPVDGGFQRLLAGQGGTAPSR